MDRVVCSATRVEKAIDSLYCQVHPFVVVKYTNAVSREPLGVQTQQVELKTIGVSSGPA